MSPNRLRYAELHAYSCFSFLEGAAHPEDLVAEARRLELHALALTDRDGVYGAPRFRAACAEAGLRGVYGAEVTLPDDARVVLLVQSLRGWENLCRLLTRGRRRSAKGRSEVTFEEVAERAEGLVALSGGPRGEVERALKSGDEARAEAVAARYRDAFGARRFYLELHHHLLSEEDRVRGLQRRLARRLRLPLVATNHAHYAVASARRLQDVLTCIRHRTSLDQAGRRLLPNGEFHLKGAADMATRFRDCPEAVRASLEVVSRCRFGLDEVRYRLPDFPVPEGETPFSLLHRLANEGARARYRPLTPAVARQLAHELDVIDRLGFAGYFLIVHDVVQFCARRGILCQGRGSAANSVVCYALCITGVDPIRLDLLFERFLSEEREEAPDIDLDIEHERREEVLQYVYERYGREHAGMVCTFITYHARSAVRDIGKALGLSEAQVRQANKVLGQRGAKELSDALRGDAGTLHGLRLSDRRMRHLADLCARIDGFPRHLSIHTGGMVIAAAPLDRVVPIENATMPGRTVIQWDKDDVAAMGLVKIDLLGLGALALMNRAVELLRVHKGVALDLAHLPHDDPAVYDMLCRADTVGVFQVESRAQMSCLPRLRPRRFYDLVVEVALIRPGPIQGKMVHPYLRRRAGKEAVTYPHPRLRPILERTLGVPLFQEQGMRIAVAAAGFSNSEADELRRAMGHRRSHEQMTRLAQRLMAGMARNGIDGKAAERIFEQLAAFADFGFAESHAASFALLVYATAWMKHHHPDVYVTAILNAQPMGFYSPSTLVHDGRRHGVRFRPVDVRHSDWDCTLEPDGAGHAVRIGLRYVHGLGEEAGERVRAARAARPFQSVDDFTQRTGLSGRLRETLARVGAFAGFGLARRDALWQVQAAGRAAPGSLELRRAPEPPVPLPALSAAERVVEDYRSGGLSVDSQPLELWRDELRRQGLKTAAELDDVAHGTRVEIAGMVICRQKPPTAKGFCFLTLEDETGLANVIVTPDHFEANRRVVRLAPFLRVAGRLERADGVINLRGERFVEIGRALDPGDVSHDFH